MIIDSSKVGMNSSRTYTSSSFVMQSGSMTARADEAVLLDLSEESKSLMEQMKDIEKQQKEEQTQKQQQNMKEWFQKTVEQANSTQKSKPLEQTDEDWRIELLRKMLEAMRRMQNGNKPELRRQMRRLGTMSTSNAQQTQWSRDVNVSTESIGTSAPTISSGQTKMVKQTVTSAFFKEKETTAFTAQGTVHTADGRDINFGVSFEMSRAFAAQYETYTKEEYLLCDPLVINMDASVTGVEDQKFYFDLDADGTQEEVSFVGQGSGFLALDKNNDGIINDGSELFGTKSGDGFGDLAAYDKDGNGWIDEADDIFKYLKVWTKDENGNDKLLDLKEANVGAIYLGSTDTQFSLNDAANKTNGVIQKTGIYLKESGEVGTVQHVDLAL